MNLLRFYAIRKMRDGRRYFPFGARPIVRGRAVSLREASPVQGYNHLKYG